MADNSISPLQPSTTDYNIPLVRSANKQFTPPTALLATAGFHRTYTLPRLAQMESRHHTLMSPPEQKPTDSFTQSPTTTTMDSKKQTLDHAAGKLPMSPPISPDLPLVNPEDALSNTDTDPILFPSPTTSSSQTPLFNEHEALQQVVNGHIAARDNRIFGAASPPTQAPAAEEYKLTVSFQMEVMKSFSVDRRSWFQRERAQLLEDNKKRAKANGALKANNATRYARIAPASGVNISRAPRPANNTPKTGIVKSARQSRPTQKAMPDPNKPKAIREDKDYNSVPDYCPPLDTLPSNKPNSLKVEWKGSPLALGDDPDMHLLHKDEQLLAANLRLDCATYLTSKRRIFVRRLECIRIGKEFRKTDSQQACKIDVNKASKLWEAFRKVGWLDEHHMSQYN